MYRCESWNMMKVEHQRINAFELWCWRRHLRVLWTARRSNQSFLKEISPEYSLEGLLLKLKFQYFGHLMQRADSLEKILMLGKIEGKRRRGQQRMRWLDSITDSMDMNFSKLQETVSHREAWHATVYGVTKSQTWLSDWTTHMWYLQCLELCFPNPGLKIGANPISSDLQQNEKWTIIMDWIVALPNIYACMCAKSLQSYPTLCDLVDCSPPDSSVHRILQARIAECVAMLSSRGSSWPRDQTRVLMSLALANGLFTTGTTWEAPKCIYMLDLRIQWLYLEIGFIRK